MLEWLQATATQSAPFVLVTVVGVEGSGPREAGAKMLVSPTAQYDTIGGGHLELRACELARTLLAKAPSENGKDQLNDCVHIERYALGPSLGQCCGGVVHLSFEVIDESASLKFACLRQRWNEGQESWRIVPLDSAGTMMIVDRQAQSVTAGNSAASDFSLINIAANYASFLRAELLTVKDGKAQRWLIDPCFPPRSHLVLFGAGHVGAAIVRALAELPCSITWVDERDAQFPPVIPANVKIESTDTPEAIVESASAASVFLVMTHQHALDQRLAASILNRRDLAWFGLIGSKTKRRLFEHRLRECGIGDDRLAKMVCPIGLEGIHGKEPATIAASVVAQLLLVWAGGDSNCVV